MLWSLVLLPLLGALLAAGMRRRAVLTTTACAALVATLIAGLLAVGADWTAALKWSDALRLQAALTPLSAMFVILVPAVALPVVGYAGVNAARTGLPRLLALLLLFVAGMELLVIAADFLTLLIGWELVGACSWTLIAHERSVRDHARAGQYAFLVTRFGDLGLFLAAAIAFSHVGSFAFADLARLEGAALDLLVLGVVLSAAAKSGQVPFSPWLFRAMAGPAPVSALLHAATMVAAGAYLLIRLHPVLERVAWFGPVVIAIGLATALAGGLVALLQSHAKKLLAASTSAHYGLMFVAVGAGYPGVAALHLVAHACFKALLFLAAGIAGDRAGSYRLPRMRLGREMPVVAGLSAIGCAALAGLPPLGAAWTKEAVTAAAGHASPWLAGAVMMAGGLSAAYAVRFQWLAYGPGDGRAGGGAPGPSGETAALGLLALATVALSLLWWPAAAKAVARLLEAELAGFKTWETVGSLLVLAGGLYIGAVLAGRRTWAGQGTAASLAEWMGLPALIDRTVTRPTAALARAMARLDDRYLDAVPRMLAAPGRSAAMARLDDRYADALPRGTARFGRGLAAFGAGLGEQLTDGLPRGTARMISRGGEAVRRLQTGLSHHYYALISVGAVVLLVVIVLGGAVPCCR